MKPDRNPWWQTAKTPRQGFILVGIWLFLATGEVVLAVGRPRSWSWILAVVWAVGAVGYLVPAVLLRHPEAGPRDLRGGRPWMRSRPVGWGLGDR